MLLFSVFFALGLGELIVSFLKLAPDVQRISPEAHQSAYQWSDNPKLGYVLKKDYKMTGIPDLHETFPITNNIGFRDLNRKIKRKSNQSERWLVLGDSVVAGHGILEIRDLIGPQLEEIAGPNVEVISMGVGGYCTEAEVELFRIKGLEFKVDKVILVFLENDYQNFNTQVAKYRAKRNPLTESLFLNSDLFRFLSVNLDLFNIKSVFKYNRGEARNRSALDQNNNVYSGLKVLSELKSKHTFEVHIFLWPKFNGREILNQTVPSKISLGIREIAKKFNFNTYNLADVFRTQLSQLPKGKKNSERPFSIDDMHPNPLGAKIAAQGIYDFLKIESKKASE